MPLTIQISDDTVDKLTRIKHPGQTWDGIIQESLDILEALQRVEAKKDRIPVTK